MNITQLTVINACLASMGEEPINSMAEENAFVNSAKFALEQATANEQGRGWYFNTETVTIVPNARDGYYYAPADVLDLTVCEFNPTWLALRGQRLYNSAEGEFHTGKTPIKVRLIRLLSFEDLPFMARRLVKGATVILFQQSYDGDATKSKDAETEYQMAYIHLNTQHIKTVGANFLPRRGAVPQRHARLPT